ncbi:MAG: 50S ribosomal protein L20 [Solitalea-like symbiont of Acarus siro]
MPRSVNSVASRARRKKVLKLTKGQIGARRNEYTVAKNSLEKGLVYAYVHRKHKKRDFRGLWIQRINAAVREHLDISYSTYINKLTNSNIIINR